MICGDQSKLQKNEDDSVNKDQANKQPRRNPHIPPMRKTLAITVASLQGIEVSIELKNDIVMTGTLEDSDSFMNCILSKVIVTRSNGEKERNEIARVAGCKIRYIHLPPPLKNFCPFIGFY